MKEWNILYQKYDQYGCLKEYLIVLPSWWKVLWWMIRKGRRCYCVDIWSDWKN